MKKDLKLAIISNSDSIDIVYKSILMKVNVFTL